MTDKFDFKPKAKANIDGDFSDINSSEFEEKALKKAIADGIVNPDSPDDIKAFRDATKSFRDIINKVEQDFENRDEQLDVLAHLAGSISKELIEFPKKDSTKEEITAAMFAVSKIFGQITEVLGKMVAESHRLHQDPSKDKQEVREFDAGIETIRFVIKQIVLPALEQLRRAAKE